jgi:hypothetical protein
MVMDRNIPAKPILMMDDLKLRAEVVTKTAAANADAVDRDARFPAEAFASARDGYSA